MNPLAALYGAVVGVRNKLYDRGALAIGSLEGPVVSIGNLSVGGSGKTPFVILLGELLKQRGIAFDVISRGYGRTTRGVALVDPQGQAREFGDEPLLLARSLKVPVIVGEDRYAAGRLAEEMFGSQLHLLDDGFQHRALARDFDVVLLMESDVHDSLLPAGRLREPLSSLSRADAIVLTNEMSAGALQLGTLPIWRVRREIVRPETSAPVLAFCGIARPQNFFQQLQAAGINVVATRTFRDHHAYTAGDLQNLLRWRTDSRADAFVTTEKDAVNLGPRLSTIEPVHVVRIRMQLHNADATLEAILATINERKHRFA